MSKWKLINISLEKLKNNKNLNLSLRPYKSAIILLFINNVNYSKNSTLHFYS